MRSEAPLLYDCLPPAKMTRFHRGFSGQGRSKSRSRAGLRAKGPALFRLLRSRVRPRSTTEQAGSQRGTAVVASLEEITVGTSVKGVLPDSLITVVAVEWFGDRAINLTYRDPAGQLGNELVYRDREPSLEVAVAGRPWSFDGDGG